MVNDVTKEEELVTDVSRESKSKYKVKEKSFLPCCPMIDGRVDSPGRETDI